MFAIWFCGLPSQVLGATMALPQPNGQPNDKKEQSLVYKRLIKRVLKIKKLFKTDRRGPRLPSDNLWGNICLIAGVLSGIAGFVLIVIWLFNPLLTNLLWLGGGLVLLGLILFILSIMIFLTITPIS
ncbi:MAG: hypothetical protein MUC97_17465 [Bernardetiaceae bacterium]|nr:hypothetical protein [Bernardetiaceae bacterium]